VRTTPTPAFRISVRCRVLRPEPKRTNANHAEPGHQIFLLKKLDRVFTTSCHRTTWFTLKIAPPNELHSFRVPIIRDTRDTRFRRSNSTGSPFANIRAMPLADH
jgi:hypothetical protein